MELLQAQVQPKGQPKVVLSRERVRLSNYITNGVPNDIADSWTLDFSYKEEHERAELMSLLADSVWCRLAGQVNAKYGVDFIVMASQKITELNLLLATK